MTYNPAYILPWPQVMDYINSKYQILETISLDSHCYRMTEVYDQLLPYRSKNFLPNEKIIFYMVDTQFYLGNTGFTIYNLQLILKNLDISQSAIILITNQDNIKDQVHMLGKSICNDDWPMKVFSSIYIQCISSPSPEINNSTDDEKINYPYVTLNGEQRVHRVMLLSMLKEFDLLEKGIATWNFSYKKQDDFVEEKPQISKKSKLNFLVTDSPTKLNELISWNDNLISIYQRHSTNFVNQSGFTVDIGDRLPQNASKFDMIKHRLLGTQLKDYYQSSFLTVITETAFDYPTPFISEKTMRSFINRRPFIIIGPCGTIKKINELGFKTFSSIFDEGYDTVSDPSERITKIVDVINKISNLSLEELRQLLKDIEPILEHNYRYYHNNFSKSDLEKALQNL